MRLIGVGLIALLAGACGGESAANKPQGSVGGTQNAAQGGDALTAQNQGGTGVAAGGAGTAGTGSVVSTRSFVPNRGCRSDADCPSGVACAKYTPNGPGGCEYKPMPATSCMSPGGRDECCSSDECPGGGCFSQVVGAGIACGNGGFDTYNQCVSDSCRTDADCSSNAVCTGPSPFRQCLPVACRSDADCTATPGGACVAISGGCCGPYAPRAWQLACVYPSDGCQKNEDCPMGQVCVVNAGRAQCAASCGGP